MTYNNYVSTFQRESKSMSKEIRKINPELAKKFLERERKLGVSIGILTVLFFLVYCPTIALRKVSFEPNNNSLCQVIIAMTYLYDQTWFTVFWHIYKTDCTKCTDHTSNSNTCLLDNKLVNRNHRSVSISDSPQRISRRGKKSF